MEHDHSLVDKSVEVPEVVNSPNLMTFWRAKQTNVSTTSLKMSST